jgi:hypothetical protein
VPNKPRFHRDRTGEKCEISLPRRHAVRRVGRPMLTFASGSFSNLDRENWRLDGQSRSMNRYPVGTHSLTQGTRIKLRQSEHTPI